ncbi:MAG: FAD:protein FMN transferase [Chloroflexota bacterium]|nr:FAD:protein FMN transferase [Chloroflexota bacterium]
MVPEVAAAADVDGMAEHRFECMGCEVLALAPPDRPEAGPMAQTLFSRWDARFSRFRPDSELEALNNAGGRPFVATPEMLAALRLALQGAAASDGLFDPLLGARMVELGYDHSFDELPTEGSARPLARWRPGAWRRILIDVDRSTVQLPNDARVDLGGLAKGMAVDAAIAALAEAKVPYAAVNAGGDLAVLGLPPGRDAWPVAIEAPGAPVVSVREGALATSSFLRRRWTVNGIQRHHLLDPRTGLPATGPIVQATVAAASCGQAEVAAKMALLSEPARAVDLLEEHRLAGLLLLSSGELRCVGAWG